MPHLYIVLFSAAAVWLFKAGKLNFIVKKALQVAYKSLFGQTEDFKDFIEVKEKKENVEIENGFYSYEAKEGLLNTVKYLDFNLNFSFLFNKDTSILKQSVTLSKGGSKHKFTIVGQYEVKGGIVTFKPTEGDLTVLPVELRNKDLKFLVIPSEKGLLVSFNENQFGKNNALFFEAAE